MRTRRHFQPVLDSMPIRIAPSTVAIASPAHVTTVIISTSVSPTLTMHAQDTNMPETGSSTPVTPTPTPTPTKAG
jgi:hypothetical protein